MCGINGYIQFSPRLTKDEINATIRSMNNCILHRGPDADGVLVDTNVGLGMRRLAIIDLTTGDQPIYNEDKSKAIVLNGEIYNFRELHHMLKKKGHAFTTKTDTETILHCYEEYGRDCLNMLNGMFAFMIYDMHDGSLFIARDRVGEKPLYYYKNNFCMLFASELKSIISTGIVDKKISYDALAQYFQLSYIPAPLSIFDSVYKLPQATYMYITNDGTMRSETYWDVPFSANELIYDEQKCKRLLRETVYHAVEKCLISDVPIGTFLSGGIDSTIITAIASEIGGKKIDTFNIGFYDRNSDESQKAKIVAKKYNTNHHIHMLKDDESYATLPQIIANMDEPFADSSIVATYIVAREAANNVKVILTGDTGDELFGGYSKYAIEYYANWYNRMPRFIRKGIIETIWSILPDKSTLSRQVGKVIRNADKDILSQRIELMCLGFKHDELRKLCPGLPEETLNFISGYYSKIASADEMTRTQYTDLKVVLEGDMFVKTDRAAMLASLETRTPLIDPSVIELAYRIPSQFKVRGSSLKVILKSTFADLIPNEIINAPKHGFGVPVSLWLRYGLKCEMLDFINKDLLQSQGIFEYDYISEIYREHLSAKINRSGELWAFYIFQKWYEKWMN